VQQLLLRDGDGVRFGPNQEGGLPEVTFESPRWPGQNSWRRLAAASLAGGLLMALVMLGLGLIQGTGTWLLVGGVALLATLAESVIGATLQSRWSWLSNEVVNGVQTLLAALLALAAVGLQGG
jgi:hypothetical protein